MDECGAPVVSIPGRRAADASADRRNCEGLVARKKYIYLCTNALLLSEAPPRIHAQQVSVVFRPHGWQREHHDFSVCREGTYDKAVEGNSHGARARLPRHHQHHAVRRRRSRERPPVLRRHDGAGRRGHDAFARLHLRQGSRPGAFPEPEEDAQSLPPDLEQPLRKRGGST